MRKGGVVVALAIALAGIGTTAAAELQLINRGSLSAKAAQDKFVEAWKACAAELAPGYTQDALYTCINRKFNPHHIEAVR